MILEAPPGQVPLPAQGDIAGKIGSIQVQEEPGTCFICISNDQ